MLGLNKYILAGVGAVILLMGAYIWYQESEIETLTENNIKLEQSVETQQEVIDQQEQDMEDYREAVGRLTRERETLRNELNDLEERFDKSKPDGTQRDLGKLGVARPESVERVLNAATREANRCMEIAAGASLTEEERSATRRSEINSECPVIANPNYMPEGEE